MVAKGVSEEMPAAREVAARRPRGLPPPQNARLMWGSEPLPRSHCGGKGEKLPWAPSGLIHPTRFPNQHVAAWVPLHTGAKRLKVKKIECFKTFALYLATVLQFKTTAFLAGEFIISIFNCCSFRTAGSPDIFAGCFITEIDDWALNFYSASKS